MTVEQELELMRGMLNDLIARAAKHEIEAEKRDAEYDKLRRRMLLGALGLMGIDETEGEHPQ
jgi:hypothetical protein